MAGVSTVQAGAYFEKLMTAAAAAAAAGDPNGVVAASSTAVFGVDDAPW